MESLYEITEIQKYIDEMNIEVLLFTSSYDSKEYRVRVRDLDAEENITIKFFKTLAKAKEFYNETTRNM